MIIFLLQHFIQREHLLQRGSIQMVWCRRLGFGAGIFPANAAEEFKITYNGIASEIYSTTAAPVQFAAADIYNNMDQLTSFINAQQSILNELSQIIVQKLRSSDIRIHQPNGGFYIFPDFSNYTSIFTNNGIDTAEKFCVDLLNKGVAMLPPPHLVLMINNIFRVCVTLTLMGPRL